MTLSSIDKEILTQQEVMHKMRNSKFYDKTYAVIYQAEVLHLQALATLRLSIIPKLK